MAARVLPQTGEESDLHSGLLRPRPASHDQERLALVSRPPLLSQQLTNAAPPAVMAITIETPVESIAWPVMAQFAEEAGKLYVKQAKSSAETSRLEEISQLWAEIVGLDLAECRAQARVAGSVDLAATIHNMLQVCVRLLSTRSLSVIESQLHLSSL